MTPQELKNSILQLAIQGRLVEQRPDEGTAEELYRQIQREKAALVKAGKIKKEKPLPEITEEEVPFEIPETWKWCYVGDVFSHNTGKAMNSSTKKVDKEGAIRKFITTSNLYWNRFDFSNIKEMFFSDDEVDRCTVTYGDILMCEGGAYYGRTAIWYYDYDICFQNHVHRLRAYTEISREYFYYVFYFYRNTGMMQSKGTAMPGLSSVALHSLIIPVPPLAEQKRIVAKIEELLPYIDRYEAAWSRLEDFNKRFPTDMQKSILQLAIQGKLVPQRPEEGTGEALYQQIQAEKQSLIRSGKLKKEKPLPEITPDEIPFDIPENWKWVRLADIAYLTSGNQYNETESGIPYLKVADMNLPENKLEITTSSRFTSPDNNGIIPKHSIIFPKRGGAIATNKKKIVRNQPVYIDSNSMGMTAIIAGVFDYMRLWFDSIDMGKLQTGTSVPQINNKDLYPLLFPLPPLAEQKRIVAKLEEFMPICDKVGEL